MKSVLISIKPKWCGLIAERKCSILVRKTAPKIETPFKSYVYCTKDGLLTRSHFDGKIYVASSRKYQTALERNGNITLSGKVIGEFVCDRIILVDCDSVAPFDEETHEYIQTETCIDRGTFARYTNFRKALGWHISDLKIYDKPKELDEFLRICPYDEHCWRCEFYSTYNGKCNNFVNRPPQSYMFVEELQDV